MYINIYVFVPRYIHMSGGQVAVKHLSLARIEALLCGGKGLLLPRHGALMLARRARL